LNLRRDLIVLGDDGLPMDAKAAARRLRADQQALIKATRFRSALASLDALAQREPRLDLTHTIARFRHRNSFSPNEMAFVVWRFKVNRIAFQPNCFPVSLRGHRQRQQLLAMEDWKLSQILPCMTPSQIKWLGERRAT
jgi:hypothetical protein